MSKEEIIEKIKKYFSDKNEVIAVYLYGSYARNKQKDDSDIDLAVLFTDNIDNALSLRFAYEDQLSKILLKKIEIQELNICRIDFAYRVLQEGILIYSGNNNKRIQFEINTMNSYFDLKPFFDEFYSVLRNQSLRGDFNAR